MEEPMDIDGQLDQQMAPQLPAFEAQAPVQIACPFQANACGRVFPNDRQVKVHLLNDHKAKQYLCPITGCLEAFRTMDGLFRHLDQMSDALELEQDQAVRAYMHPAYDESVCVKCGIDISRDHISLGKLDKIFAHKHKQAHLECIKPDCRVADGGTEVDLLVHSTLAHTGLVELAAAAARHAQGNEPVPDAVPEAADENAQPVLGPVLRAGQDNEPVANHVPGDPPRNGQNSALAIDAIAGPSGVPPNGARLASLNINGNDNGRGNDGRSDSSDGENGPPNITRPERPTNPGASEPVIKRSRLQ